MENKTIETAKQYLSKFCETPINNDFENYRSLPHLMWMASEISTDTMNPTKASRWLGFLQIELYHLDLIKLNDIFSLNEIQPIPDLSKHYQLLPVVTVAKRYLSNLSDYSPIASFDSFNNINHLVWMLNQICNGNLSEITANRWLGAIQSELSHLNLVDISTERSETRSIFNGK